MKYFLSIVIIVVLLHSAAFAQNPAMHQRDSMLAIVNHAKDDTNKVKLLFAIGKTYGDENPDTALAYIQRSGTLSEKLNYDQGTFHYLFAAVPLLGEMNRLDECMSVSQKALSLSKKVGNKAGVATALFDIGGVYAQKGQFENALNYYLQTDTALRETHDTLRTCIIYSKIAGCYINTAQQRKGYDYAIKAIKLGTAIGSEQGVVGGLLKAADALGELKRNDSALIFYRQAKDIYAKHNDDYGIITILVNTNHILKSMGRYDELLAPAEEVLRLSEKVHRIEGLCEGNIEKGTYYFYKKQFGLAAEFAGKALQIALTREHPQTLDECYTLLANINLGAGNMPEFVRYAKMQDSVHEALISDRMLKNTQELETKYNVEQKEHDLAQQQLLLKQKKQENTMLIVLLMVITAAVVLGILSYSNKRRLLLSEQALQQQKITRLEAERQLLATQSVMQGQEEERSRLAKDLHDGLGGILSGAKYSLSHMKENLIVTPDNAAAFERTMNMLDLSITEMRRVAHNMMPESLMKLNLNEALLDYCDQVNDSGAIAIDYQSSDMDTLVLNDSQKITVYRIVQELINNTIKHAAASTIIVQVFPKERTLYLTVEDNGKGFDKTQLVFSSGIGYKNIKNRIDYLNGKLDVQSEPGKGTSVYIEIPLQ